MLTTDDCENEFQFAPLDLEIDSLRIITLQPRAKEIHCSLEHRTFASRPAYETLSYTWGPDKPKERIYVNGKCFFVRKNLYDALAHLQQDTPRTIWVDAISIDQSNIPERNYQVNLMPFIYTRSSSVLVWLNLSLKKPEKQRQDDPPTARLREMLYMEENRKSITNLQYWTRVWVKQEYILPKEVKILLDEFVLSEEEFYRITYDIRQKYFMETINTLKEHREKRHTEDFRLEHLIRTFRQSNCTETRDKIFGFLGLAHDNELDADYGMSYVDLYKALINSHQDSEAEVEDWRTANANDRAAKLMHFSELVQDALQGEVESERQSGTMIFETRTFTAKGATVSRILSIGPTHDEVVSSMNAEKAWRSAAQMHFGKRDVLPDFLTADKKFTRSLLTWSQQRIDSIRRVAATESHAYRLEPGDDALAIRAAYNDISGETLPPRRFIGTRGCFGMAPAGTRVGDALACFLDCESYVVLRPLGKDCWTIVGKAVGTTVQFRGRSEFDIESAVRDELNDYWISRLEEDEWDRGEGVFQGMRNLINLQLDVHTLQQLTT